MGNCSIPPYMQYLVFLAFGGNSGRLRSRISFGGRPNLALVSRLCFSTFFRRSFSNMSGSLRPE